MVRVVHTTTATATSRALGWHEFRRSQLNGSAALIDSALGYRTASGTRTCTRAASHGNSPFTPLDTAGTSNDNLFFNWYPGHGVQPSTGLGVPELGQVKSLLQITM